MRQLMGGIRLVLLVAALTVLVGGLLPASMEADVTAAGPCLDDGCPGGDSFCDYVIINGQPYPCNLGAVIEEEVN